MNTQTTADKSANKMRAPWLLYRLGSICAAATLALAACGGTPDALIVDPPAAKASDPVPPGPAATVLAGLYKGTLDSNPNHEFLAMVVPASGKNVQVYGWYYGAADAHLAHLYSGQLELGTLGIASNVPQTWKVSEGIDPNPYLATANVSNGSLTKLVADLSIGRSSITNYQLVTDGLSATSYNFNAAPIDLRTSQWNGYWSSKANTVSGKMVFGANAMPNVSDTLWSCFAGTPPLTWTWAAQSTNYFKVTLSLGSITLCQDWQNRRLEGVAVISRQNGLDQLDMMLLDGTGAGISYRGTR